MTYRVITLTLLLCSTSAIAGLLDAPGRSNFVFADQAFAFDLQQQQHDVNLSWQTKDSYYPYRQQFTSRAVGAAIDEPASSAGEQHQDEFYGKSGIFRQCLTVSVTVKQTEKDVTLTVIQQGCADAGFCYPPETKVIPLSAVLAASADGQATAIELMPLMNSRPAFNPPLPVEPRSVPELATSPAPVVVSPADTPARLSLTALWVLLIGIGTAFTPCALPMHPLIPGIVLGGKRWLSTACALLLAFIYVQGMTLTYTTLGLVVTAAGLQFQVALQYPYVLAGLSAVFILLALSMLGLLTFQLPSSLQTWLVLLNNKRQGDSPDGVFAMGAIAGLICSPCTTAPLSAILLYIAQSGNLWLGGGTLYLYVLGTGLPLILITVFGNHPPPKSGPWMSHVKTAFGFVILALPVFLLERIVDDLWGLRLWSILGVAFLSWAFIISLGATRPRMRLVQAILLAATLASTRPPQDWAFGVPAAEQQAHLTFTCVNSVAEPNQALVQTKGQPVMFDLYADWCMACKEFEKYIFSSPDVQQALKGTVLLQIDATKSNPQNVALLKHLQVLSLPTILFLNAEGQEQFERRVTGSMDAAAFNVRSRDWQARATL